MVAFLRLEKLFCIFIEADHDKVVIVNAVFKFKRKRHFKVRFVLPFTNETSCVGMLEAFMKFQAE